MAAAPLTADLCAVAIIAAARSYGDDPLALGRLGRSPRFLAPAAGAIAACGLTGREAARRLLGLHPKMSSFTTRSPSYQTAMQAALAALNALPAPSPAPPNGGGGGGRKAPPPTVRIVNPQDPRAPLGPDIEPSPGQDQAFVARLLAAGGIPRIHNTPRGPVLLGPDDQIWRPVAL